MGENRQQVCCGLSGPGLRLSYDVASGKRNWQHVGLDLRQVRKTDIVDGALNRLWKIQLAKCLVGEQRPGVFWFRHRRGF